MYLYVVKSLSVPVLYLSVVVFGGYASPIKVSMVDRKLVNGYVTFVI